MPVEIQGLQSHLQVNLSKRSYDCLSNALLQELEADKEMQVAQFAEIADKVARCNKTSRELQDEMKDIRNVQEKFNELLSEKTVSL